MRSDAGWRKHSRLSHEKLFGYLSEKSIDTLLTLRWMNLKMKARVFSDFLIELFREGTGVLSALTLTHTKDEKQQLYTVVMIRCIVTEHCVSVAAQSTADSSGFRSALDQVHIKPTG